MGETRDASRCSPRLGVDYRPCSETNIRFKHFILGFHGDRTVSALSICAKPVAEHSSDPALTQA